MINIGHMRFKPTPTPNELSYWIYLSRADRPDEWTMDEYIRGALYLEQQIKELEARSKQLESAVSDLLETLCDELGLSYVMSNIESIDKACSLLSGEHKFSKSTNIEPPTQEDR